MCVPVSVFVHAFVGKIFMYTCTYTSVAINNGMYFSQQSQNSTCPSLATVHNWVLAQSTLKFSQTGQEYRYTVSYVAPPSYRTVSPI